MSLPCLVSALLAAAPQVAIPPAPRGPAAGRASLDASISSYPPCQEVTLTANATGRPPLAFSWKLPSGQILTGNPVVLDTGLLPTGYNTIDLTVTNDAGQAEYPVALVVEDLGFAAPPSLTVVSGTTVAAQANTTGATEWRWTWGDGTTTPWTSGCDGDAPTHTYPATGTYQVTVEARSCRAGPISQTGTLTLGSPGSITVDRFEPLCSTTPFCTFDVGQDVLFDLETSVPADSYAYDWNGDGTVDQVASSPVLVHAFGAAGYLTPTVTVFAGTATATGETPAPIQIVAPTSGLLFSDDFETGDLSRWSQP